MKATCGSSCQYSNKKLKKINGAVAKEYPGIKMGKAKSIKSKEG